ncbi:hypothetical protein MNBD_BACTEROID01-2357 [hydrothermal vent metagenome]|uniref:HMA domain-containing protein n=1 Tax=hydrothermal vent metagenome TaxID=652676 RepID=A0A3B0U6J3_9ZZZZ
MKKDKKLIGTGLLTAIASSLCCITPVLALISGTSGIASTFSWMKPFRPYLIGTTILVLAFAWYQKLKPRTKEEIACDCEEDGKPPFLQSKMFLGIVTVFAVLILAFPYYADIFYPSNDKKEVIIVNASNIRTVQFDIKGMTCNGCASHIENEVNKLSGIVSANVSYEQSNAKVEFDNSKTNIEEIEKAINSTGYKVVKKNNLK